jgi:hypothetical protein
MAQVMPAASNPRSLLGSSPRCSEASHRLIDPERVVLAIKMGPYEEVTPPKTKLDPQDENAFTKAKERESKKLSKFTFSSVGIPVGATLNFTRDPSVYVKVGNENKIE